MEESDRVCRGRINSAWCMAGAGFCGDTVSDVKQQDKKKEERAGMTSED